VNGLALEVHVGKIEPDGLGASEPAGVKEFEERAVAKRERPVTLGELEQPVDLGSLPGLGGAPRASG